MKNKMDEMGLDYRLENAATSIVLNEQGKVAGVTVSSPNGDYTIYADAAQDTDRALEIIADMKLRKEKPIYVLGSVLKVITDLYTVKVLIEGGYNDFEISKELKLHEYKVSLYRKSCNGRSLQRLKKLLGFCTETDMKLKSSSLDDYTELDKLVILATAK